MLTQQIVTNYEGTVKVSSDHSKRTPKSVFQYQLSLNAGQKYCRMLKVEHSAIFSTSIKLPFSIKFVVLSFFLSGGLRQVLLYLKSLPLPFPLRPMQIHETFTKEISLQTYWDLIPETLLGNLIEMVLLSIHNICFGSATRILILNTHLYLEA